MIYDGFIFFTLLFSALYSLNRQTPYAILIGFFLLSQCFLYTILSTLTYNSTQQSIAQIIAFGLIIGPIIFFLLLRILPSISKKNRKF